MHIWNKTRKVIATREDVAAFNAQWPCSTLRASRAYWFEFDESGDLVDTDCPEHDDGPAALAMADDCKAFLQTGDLPDWASDTSEPIPVLFRAERSGACKGDVTAVFPTLPASDDSMTCYAHIGQHSGCSLGWYHSTRAATPEEYNGLLRELQGIGYRMTVYSRLQRGWHDERREALRR